MLKGSLSLEEARERIVALASPLPAEHVDVESAVNRYLAEPLLACRTQPPANLSAMDGYAVRSDDLRGPWTVAGESAAGHPYAEPVAVGRAVRVSTGAIVPDGAGAIILQEDVSLTGNTLHLNCEPPSPPNKHIRPRGMDFSDGDTVIPAGIRVGPAQVALAIAAGHRQLPVHRQPKAVVIDSGDELAPPAVDCAVHQIPASNGAMLAALAAPLTSSVTRTGPVPDTLEALMRAFEAAANADVIITSGGASVGDHDLVRPALETWGANISFWRVAIKPGKPLLVATRVRSDMSLPPQVILGLPGNPVSSFVTAYHFLMPLLRRMQGAKQLFATPVATRTTTFMRETGPRREFLRGYWDGRYVTPQTLQDSGALTSLAPSNALIDRPAYSPALDASAEVSVFLLQNGGII